MSRLTPAVPINPCWQEPFCFWDHNLMMMHTVRRGGSGQWRLTGTRVSSRERHRDKMSLPAWARRPDSPPVSQSTPVAGILLWITVNRGELGQTGWIGTGRGNGDNPKDKQNISPDTWKKGCPDSPHLAQFTPAVPIHPHGQYIQSRKTYNNIIRN